MKERILEIIQKETMTSTHFADKIGVQRSSVSHVINGRNKPGFEFIQKILVAFQDINAEWLLTGRGEMYKSQTKEHTLFTEVENDTEKKSGPEVVNDIQKSNKGQGEEREISGKERKKIEKILVFFKDKTFKEYYPES